MRREIARLHRQLGTTMIYVTHDQVEAMTLGDRIVVLHQGAMQQVDTPAALYERPRNTFVASFIGTPPMNLIEGRLSERRFEADGFAGWQTGGWPAGTGAPQGRGSFLESVRRTCSQRPPPADSATSIAARVELVELLGGEALVHVRRREHRADRADTVARPNNRCRFPARRPARQGSSVRRGFRARSSATRQASHASPCRAHQCPMAGKMDGDALGCPR